MLLQWRFGLLGDVSWLITVDEKWLDGATPYRDVIEINPPASLMLYWPAVALARVLGVTPEFTVAAFGFLSIAAGLGLAAAILRRAGLLDRLGALGAWSRSSPSPCCRANRSTSAIIWRRSTACRSSPSRRRGRRARRSTRGSRFSPASAPA